MGRKARPKPKRLAEKLFRIREALSLSQSEIFSRLDVEDFSELKRISDYETGKNEPPLPVLLRYARVAGVCLERLVDDELDLPARLPAKSSHKP
jgi:transcriptional regulator with XRE-family HTH domain